MASKSSAKCPQCGAAVPENAPAGLCPNCLMALNLKTETVLTADLPGAQPTLPPEQIAPHFPQLEILEFLGRGGMGVVYKARQKSLNRLVALKLLAPERVDDARFADRFAREAQALAALNHQNIVTVYDFGRAGGFYFLLMEFVDGVNLRQLLRAKKFTPEEALAIVPPLCDALQFAHERGIVHRDIKPENILLDKAGRVKIADFGIAKMLGAPNGQTGEGASSGEATHAAMGTPGYIAPEQKAEPQRADSRADIYSLGVVFYEMLTGELPGKPITLPSKKVQVDVRLDEVVLRALEQVPDLRWQTAGDLRTQVEAITATSNVHDSRRRAANSGAGTVRGRLRPMAAGFFVGVCAVILLALGGWAYVRHLERQRFNRPSGNYGVSPGVTVESAKSTDILGAESASSSSERVIHRTLYDLDDGGRRTNAAMIDLDSGRVFSRLSFESPAEESFGDDFEGLRRMRKQGVDLCGDTSGKSFVAFEMIVVPTEQPFDELTLEDIATHQRLNGLPKTESAVTVQDLPATYLFKTREGGRGVMEVIRFGINLESMDIRYKVLPPRYQFVRYVVILSPEGGGRYLSLQDAKGYAAMPTNAPVVYMEKRSDLGWCVVVENVHNYPAERERGIELWNAMSAEAISQPAGLAGLPFERTGVYQLDEDRLPITVLIPEYGLLQIAGRDDRTKQVILEFKRVTTNGPSAPASHTYEDRRSTGQRRDQPADGNSTPQASLQGQEPTAQEIRKVSVEEWFQRLGTESDAGFIALNALVRKAKQGPEIREAIIGKAIITIDDPLEHEFRRWQCCYLLSGLREPRGIPAIARALKDQSEVVRAVAACALGQFEDAAVRTTLEEAGRTEKSSRVLEDIRKALNGDFRRKE